MSESKIQFIQNHQPALTSGSYVLEVTLDNPAAPDDSSLRQATIKRCFTVSGERFALKPMDIQAVFPPAGSLGDHSNVLPHLILKRSTLPWERKAVPSSNDIPWLALLLFDEQQAPKSEVKTLGDLKGTEDSGPEDKGQDESKAKKSQFPAFELESGQDLSDQVTIIDVTRKSLKDILPASHELKYLAHVRRGTDSQEFSVIIGNRLPKHGGASIVHLVSMEGRLCQDGTFNYQGAREDDDLIRLVSLYSWRFACEDEEQSFKYLLLNLIPGSRTLRLPESAKPNADAEKYLGMGCAPLPHMMREGDKIVSWYHGPLLPGKNVTTDPPGLPIRNSDQLLRFDSSLGLLDVSYAAAWELGKFLALQSSNFSTELFNWRRSHTQRSQGQKIQESKRELKHLPPGAPTLALALPPGVKTWFERVEHLEGIPFNYLVSDEHMLPPESIRFFFLDWLWLECLQDGAFSIGRVTKIDHELHADLKKSLDSALEKCHLSTPSRPVSGFLLRSDVVAGWPGLLVDGYDNQGPMSLLRMDRLSKNILICLFDGELAAIEIHLKPETMHFGVNKKDSTKLDKNLRTADGSSSKTNIDIVWRNEDSRVINIGELAKRMATGNSARFAFQMIEGVEKVRFKLI